MDSDYRESENNGMHLFEATWMIVDDILSHRSKINGNYFFNLREDFYDIELSMEMDGYIDDSAATCVWDSAHYVENLSSFEHGDIDEDFYLKTGSIVGKNHPDMAKFKAQYEEYHS